jgi:hypothetical protein
MVGGRFGWARPRKSEPVPKPASPQPASSAREKSTHFGLSEPRTDSSAWLRRQWPHDCDADARSEFVLRRTPPKVTCSFALARWRLSAVVESSEAVVPEKRPREESKGEAEIPPLTPPAVEFAFAFDVAIKGRCRKKKVSRTAASEVACQSAHHPAAHHTQPLACVHMMPRRVQGVSHEKTIRCDPNGTDAATSRVINLVATGNKRLVRAERDEPSSSGLSAPIV